MSAFLLSAVLLGLRPQLADVSLRPGLHSYRQLAEELSDQGLRVQCDASIRWRYALIRVPPSPWEALKSLLEAALDVQFVATGDGILTIRKNSRKAEIEDALLRRFSRQYSQTIQDAVRDGYERYRQLETTSSRRGTTDAIANMLDSIRSLPAGNPDRNALTVAVNLKQEIGQHYVYAQLWDGIDIAKLLRGSEPILSTSDQVATASPPDNPIGEIVPPPIRSFGVRLSDGESALAPIQVEQWRLDPRTFGLAKELILATDMASPAFGKGVTEFMPDVVEFDFGWDDLYRGLAGQRELRARQKATQTWLSAEMAARSLKSSSNAFTMSELFSVWSRETRHPVIMEVVADREPSSNLSDSFPAGLSIADAFRALAEESVNPKLLRTPWTVEEIGGVAVVRNELRFADHIVPFNPAALIALETAKDAAPGSGVTIPDLIAAAGNVGVDDQMAAIDYQTYGALADFPLACPYLRLIASDPGSLKDLKALRKGDDLKFPAIAFTKQSRRAFEKTVRQIALKTPSSWSTGLWPDFDQVFTTGTIMVTTTGVNGHPSLGFHLVSPLVKGPKAGLCPVKLGSVDLRD